MSAEEELCLLHNNGYTEKENYEITWKFKITWSISNRKCRIPRAVCAPSRGHNVSSVAPVKVVMETGSY